MVELWGVCCQLSWDIKSTLYCIFQMLYREYLEWQASHEPVHTNGNGRCEDVAEPTPEEAR